MYCGKLHAWWSGIFSFLFDCTPEGRTSDSMAVPTLRLTLYLYMRWLGPDAAAVVGPTRV